MNKALGGLGITVLNFNSGQTYNCPNILEVTIFCKLIDEEKFLFSEIRKTLKGYGLKIFAPSPDGGLVRNWEQFGLVGLSSLFWE